MKIRTLAAIIAAPMFLLPITSIAAPVINNPALHEVKPKIATTLKVDSVMTIPGEKKTYKALLTTQKGPLANKKVAFKIDRKDAKDIIIGTADTDANGQAKIDFAIMATATDVELAQGSYDIKATFAGDDQHTGSIGDANLGLFKGIVELNVQHSYGVYKDEGGKPYHTLTISLVRKVDQKGLDKKLLITDNGKTTPYTIGQYLVMQVVLQPMYDPIKHKVHIQFEGDGSYLATGYDNTYFGNTSSSP